MSIRAAADRFGINFMTLYRYVKKSKLAPDNPPSVGYAKPSKIFTQQQEEELAEYVEDCSKIYYGLTTRDLRKLAYDLAVANKNKIPYNWINTQMASKD
jgi:transposase